MSRSIVDSGLVLLIESPLKSFSLEPLAQINGAGEDGGGLGAVSGGSRRSDELAKQERSQDVRAKKALGDAQGAEMVPKWLGGLTISLTEANTSEGRSSGFPQIKCTLLPEGKVRRCEEVRSSMTCWIDHSIKHVLRSKGVRLRMG